MTDDTTTPLAKPSRGRVDLWVDDLGEYRWTEWAGNHIDRTAVNGEGLTHAEHAVDQAIEHAGGRVPVTLARNGDKEVIFPALPGAAAIVKRRQLDLRHLGDELRPDAPHLGIDHAQHADDVVDAGVVARRADGPGAVVGVGDVLQLGQVGDHRVGRDPLAQRLGEVGSGFRGLDRLGGDRSPTAPRRGEGGGDHGQPRRCGPVCAFHRAQGRRSRGPHRGTGKIR